MVNFGRAGNVIKNSQFLLKVAHPVNSGLIFQSKSCQFSNFRTKMNVPSNFIGLSSQFRTSFGPVSSQFRVTFEKNSCQILTKFYKFSSENELFGASKINLIFKIELKMHYVYVFRYSLRSTVFFVAHRSDTKMFRNFLGIPYSNIFKNGPF